MQDQQCALIRMVSESETDEEKIMRYVSGREKPDEDLSSLFDYSITQYARNHHLPREMNRTDTSGQYVFDADSAYSYLYDMEMYQVLPRVSVKKPYRGKIQICWSPYPGLNITEKATMTCGDKKIPLNLDCVWNNIYYQYYENEKTDHYNRYLGHIPLLTDWCDALPEFRLRVHQAWFFTRDMPFPLFKIKERVFFTYLLKNSIFKLLRVRVMDERKNKWVSRKIDGKIIKALNFPDKGLLPPPVMIAEYSKIGIDEETGIKEKKDCLYVVEDIRHLESPIIDSKVNPRTKIEIDISDPIKAIFYVAENCNASALNNHSNFSTDAENMDDGDKPIKAIYPTYKDSPLVTFSSEFTPEVLADYCESHYPRRCFAGFPRDPGYGVIPISYDMHQPFQESFKSGKFTIEFKLSDHYEDSEEGDEGEPVVDLANEEAEEKKLIHSYKVHVYALYLKRLTFNDKGELRINEV